MRLLIQNHLQKLLSDLVRLLCQLLFLTQTSLSEHRELICFHHDGFLKSFHNHFSIRQRNNTFTWCLNWSISSCRIIHSIMCLNLMEYWMHPIWVEVWANVSKNLVALLKKAFFTLLPFSSKYCFPSSSSKYLWAVYLWPLLMNSAKIMSPLEIFSLPNSQFHK